MAVPRHRAALAWAGIFLGAILLVTYVALDLVVDPYGEVGLFHQQRMYVDHVSGAYAAYARLERSGMQDLVFGSSLSGTIGPAQLKSPMINLSASVYGKPENIRDFLAGLNAAQWSHIGKVYCLADIRLLDDSPGDYQGRDFHSWWQRWTETVLNINGTKLVRAWDSVRHRGDLPWTVDDDGVVVHTHAKPFQPSNYFGDFGRSLSHSQRQGDALRQVDQLLRAHHTPVVYFCSVLSDYYWCGVDPDSLEPHYRCIVEAVPELVCMDYVPACSPRLDLFRDEIHHGDAITGWECGILLDPKAARRFVINRGNYKAHVAALLAHISHCQKKSL